MEREAALAPAGRRRPPMVTTARRAASRRRHASVSAGPAAGRRRAAASSTGRAARRGRRATALARQLLLVARVRSALSAPRRPSTCSWLAAVGWRPPAARRLRESRRGRRTSWSVLAVDRVSAATSDSSATSAGASGRCSGGGRRGRATCSATRSQLRSNSRATSRRASSGRGRRAGRAAASLVVGSACEPLVVEELVEERGPALVEGELGGELVGDLDPRRQPGRERVLGQEALGEGVQRATAAPSSSSEGGAARSARRTGVGLAAGRSSSRRRTRSRSSAAALSVKVMAAISRIGTPPRPTSARTRSTSERASCRTGAGLDEQGGVELGDDALGARRRRAGAAQASSLASSSGSSSSSAGQAEEAHVRRQLGCVLQALPAPLPPPPCRGRRDRRPGR